MATFAIAADADVVTPTTLDAAGAAAAAAAAGIGAGVVSGKRFRLRRSMSKICSYFDAASLIVASLTVFSVRTIAGFVDFTALVTISITAVSRSDAPTLLLGLGIDEKALFLEYECEPLTAVYVPLFC